MEPGWPPPSKLRESQKASAIRMAWTGATPSRVAGQRLRMPLGRKAARLARALWAEPAPPARRPEGELAKKTEANLSRSPAAGARQRPLAPKPPSASRRAVRQRAWPRAVGLEPATKPRLVARRGPWARPVGAPAKMLLRRELCPRRAPPAGPGPKPAGRARPRAQPVPALPAHGLAWSLQPEQHLPVSTGDGRRAFPERSGPRQVPARCRPALPQQTSAPATGRSWRSWRSVGPEAEGQGPAEPGLVVNPPLQRVAFARWERADLGVRAGAVPAATWGHFLPSAAARPRAARLGSASWRRR
jgi:hypothetical protein